MSVGVREWQWLEENPVSKLRKLKESKGRERLLSEEELDRLLEATKQSANKDLHTAVVLALNTGARKMEIWGLRWREVDLDKGLIQNQYDQFQLIVSLIDLYPYL